MSNNERRCPVCTSSTTYIFPILVMSRIEAHIAKCDRCGWCGYHDPSWLDAAYSNAISIADTGVLSRNIYLASRCKQFLVDSGIQNGKFLDASGGYGLFVRLMRDEGFDFYWNDPYAENIFAKGFEASSAGSKFEAVTLFEVLEHLPAPLDFVEYIFKTYSPKFFVFSTELYAGDCPSKDWWYLAPETGQHISFFSEVTLHFLASRLGLAYINFRGLHLFGSQLDIANIPSRSFPSLLASFRRRRRLKRLKSKTFTDHLQMKHSIQ